MKSKTSDHKNDCIHALICYMQDFKALLEKCLAVLSILHISLWQHEIFALHTANPQRWWGRVNGSGEFTTGFLEKVFMNLDHECSYNLSHGRFLKDKTKWANTETLINTLRFEMHDRVSLFHRTIYMIYTHHFPAHSLRKHMFSLASLGMPEVTGESLSVRSQHRSCKCSN